MPCSRGGRLLTWAISNTDSTSLPRVVCPPDLGFHDTAQDNWAERPSNIGPDCRPPSLRGVFAAKCPLEGGSIRGGNEFEQREALGKSLWRRAIALARPPGDAAV